MNDEDFLIFCTMQKALYGYEESGIGKYRFACQMSQDLFENLTQRGITEGGGVSYTFTTPVVIPADVNGNGYDYEVQKIAIHNDPTEAYGYPSKLDELVDLIDDLNSKARDTDLPENLRNKFAEAAAFCNPIVEDEQQRVANWQGNRSIQLIVQTPEHELPITCPINFYYQTELALYIVYCFTKETEE